MSALPSSETVVTPALLVDGPTLVRNITRMAARAESAGVELWPHVKTHKSREVGRLQHEHGAAGFTAATLREASCFAEAGYDRILIAYPPVGDWRIERLMALSTTSAIRVVIDSLETAAILDGAAGRAGATLAYLWEVDCGVGRVGTPRGAPTADKVAEAVRLCPQLEFDGLMTFGGHAYAAADEGGIAAAAKDESDALQETVEELRARGIESRTRSAGTTPTSNALTEAGPITEIRPGNYVFNDATQVTLGVADVSDCALTVLATVVARPDSRRLILDCGSKALAAERLTPRTTSFGFVCDYPELTVERLFEEHAVVASSEPIEIALGERLRVVPNHACATTNLHSRMYVVENGSIADVWSVDARGWDADTTEAG